MTSFFKSSKRGILARLLSSFLESQMCQESKDYLARMRFAYLKAEKGISNKEFIASYVDHNMNWARCLEILACKHTPNWLKKPLFVRYYIQEGPYLGSNKVGECYRYLTESILVTHLRDCSEDYLNSIRVKGSIFNFAELAKLASQAKHHYSPALIEFEKRLPSQNLSYWKKKLSREEYSHIIIAMAKVSSRPVAA